MSFLRHKQIYQSDPWIKTRGEADSGSAPCLIVLMSLRPAIPRQVGLHQSPPPLYQPISMLNPPAETVNHHLTGAGEFSTGVDKLSSRAFLALRPFAEISISWSSPGVD